MEMAHTWYLLDVFEFPELKFFGSNVKWKGETIILYSVRQYVLCIHIFYIYSVQAELSFGAANAKRCLVFNHSASNAHFEKSLSRSIKPMNNVSSLSNSISFFCICWNFIIFMHIEIQNRLEKGCFHNRIPLMDISIFYLHTIIDFYITLCYYIFFIHTYTWHKTKTGH